MFKLKQEIKPYAGLKNNGSKGTFIGECLSFFVSYYHFSMEKNEFHALFTNAVGWWEKKRIWYNLVVGISGAIPLSINLNQVGLDEMIGLLLFGIFMNLLYSSGIALEALNFYYLNPPFKTAFLRFPLFILGTLLSIVVTFTTAVLYFRM